MLSPDQFLPCRLVEQCHKNTSLDFQLILLFILLCSYEVRWLRKVISAMAVNQMLSFCSAKIITYAIFLVYALQYTVNTEAVFIALSLLNTIRLTVSHFMPLAVRFGSECEITFQRMQVIDKFKLAEIRHLCLTRIFLFVCVLILC